MTLKPPIQTAVFEELLDTLRHGEEPAPAAYGEVPSAFYTDPEWFQREQQTLFSDQPLLIGHTSMLPRAGDHFVHDHSGQPILVARGRDGEIRAFLNVCRHRGVRLSNAEGVSNKPSFVCPYHNWVYDLDGSLRNVPLQERCFPEIDTHCLGLTQLPLDICEGLIFVAPKPGADFDLEQSLGALKDDFRAFGMGEHVYFRESVTTKQSNWKLIIEAFLDGYHVVRLHRHSVGPAFLDGVARSRRVGDHIVSLVARKEFPEALELERENWDLRRHVSCAFFIFPNTTLIIHPDYISYLTLFPQSATETACVHGCLISEAPKDKKAAAHWERAYSIIEEGVFQAEDLFVCEQAQIGMKSGANDTLLFGELESSILEFHEIVFEKLGAFNNA